MISVNNLTKVYKLNAQKMKELKTTDSKKIAVNDVSFECRPGEIYGLLGPNGAGKTTTLRCIATLLKPTEGTILVNNFNTATEGDKVRESIAFLTNEINLDPHFTTDYLFRFFGRIHGMTEAEIDARKDALFNTFDINDFSGKKIEELSTGMKQRAAIAVTLVHDPKVVIFDEPTSGLDIITARTVTDYLKSLREMGKTVIVSTHIMSEAEKLCDRTGIIINGKKVAEGTLEEIYEQTSTTDLEDAFFELYKLHGEENR